MLLSATSAWAVDPGKNISQYAHGVWRTQDGVFTGSPIVMAQTSDGYIWIGTNTGLDRFNGIHFVSWNPPPGQQLLDPRIFSLRATNDGSLWIGTGYSVSRWKDGRLFNYKQLSGRVESIVEDDDGAIWLARTQATDDKGPVCRIKDDQSRCYGTPEGIPFNLAIHIDRSKSGELWIQGYSELCHMQSASGNPGPCTTYFGGPSQRPETFASLRAMAVAPSGAVWAAIEQSGPILELKHFEHGEWTTRSFPAITVSNADVIALFVDRDDAVWIGTAHHGIFRASGDRADHFERADGLSSDAIVSFLQDREGTVWVVTSAGLDNFRDLQIVTYSMREGLSSAGASTVLASRDNTVWVGNFQALDFLRDGKLSALRAKSGLPGTEVTTLFEDHAGLLWVGVGPGLWAYDGRAFREVRHSDGSGLGIIFAITEDVHHNIWVRAGPNHLDRIQDFKVQDELSSPQISTAYTLAANPLGGIVMGLVSGDLVQYRDGQTQIFPSNETGNRSQIRDLLVESDGSVWGTTVAELSRWKNGTRKNLTTRNGLPCDGIFALLKDRQSSIWLDTRCGLVEIERAELDSWWVNPDGPVKFRLFDALDGAQPGLTPLKPQAAQSRDGRLWFVNGLILQMMDPNHLQKNEIPPPVQVEDVIADHKTYSPRDGLRLPVLTRDLEIDYTALSFVVPQRVLFRYRLEGRDHDWQAVGNRRQAFYSNLPPGNYRFRVTACNNSGVWNEAGTFLDFYVPPAYYQTNWFRASCVVAFLALLFALYQLRLRQLAHEFNMSLEARVSERTRIARELHDTLLQSFHGLLLRFQTVYALLPSRPDEAKQSLGSAIDQAADAITEGRDAVQGLRSSTAEGNDLAAALRSLGEELSADASGGTSAAFQIEVEGTPRDLHPILRDEIYRIGGEGLRNAFQHAQAQRIELEIRYDQSQIRLRVRDDGKGIDPAVLGGDGRQGHYGLRGMRERAKLIGGNLTVWSDFDSGTEIELSIPAAAAYTTSPRRSWLVEKFSRKEAQPKNKS